MSKNFVKELTARQKATIRTIIEQNSEQDEKTVIKLVQKAIIRFGIVENSGTHNSLLALARSFYAITKAKLEGTSILVFFSKYCIYKQKTYTVLNDLGAFGDIIETAIKIASRPLNLIHYNDIHVTSNRLDFDMTLRSVKTEIGSNGKTFAASLRNDAIHGRYEQVVYGVFTEDEKNSIWQLLNNPDTVLKGVQEIVKMMYVFDKQDFFRLLTEKCGRASMIQYKPHIDKWQVIYNPSKHSAFLRMIESEQIETLAEYLKKK